MEPRIAATTVRPPTPERVQAPILQHQMKRRLLAGIQEIELTIQDSRMNDPLTVQVSRWCRLFKDSLRVREEVEEIKREFMGYLRRMLIDPLTRRPLTEYCSLASDGHTYNPETIRNWRNQAREDLRDRSPLDHTQVLAPNLSAHLVARGMVRLLRTDAPERGIPARDRQARDLAMRELMQREQNQQAINQRVIDAHAPALENARQYLHARADQAQNHQNQNVQAINAAFARVENNPQDQRLREELEQEIQEAQRNIQQIDEENRQLDQERATLIPLVDQAKLAVIEVQKETNELRKDLEKREEASSSGLLQMLAGAIISCAFRVAMDYMLPGSGTAVDVGMKGFNFSFGFTW